MPRAYRCRRCKGKPYLPKKPEGACPYCHGFYRYERADVLEGEVDGAQLPPIKDGEPISMADLMAGKDDDKTDGKRPTGSPGFDHICDGGLPKVGGILVSAMEGLGKTTWLFGLLNLLAEKLQLKTMYISSEQSGKGLRRQFARLGLPPSKRMLVLAEQDAEAIVEAIEDADPDVVAIDSVHDVEGVRDESDYDLSSGGAGAVTRVAKTIRRLSEEMGFFAFLVGHMNNDGTMTGGSHLRHEVDGTLRIDCVTNKKDPRRILSFEKCRFAETVNRSALFLMGKEGMRDCGPLEDDSYEPPVPTGSGPRGVN